MMDTLSLAAEACRKFEGLRLKAYLCPAGVPTLGYGSTGPDIHLGMTCTKEWAEARMLSDLRSFWSQVVRSTPEVLLLTPGQQACILDWSYNLGLARWKSSTFRKRVREGRLQEVPEQIRKWVYAGGKKLPGLVARREYEVQLWLSGQ